MVKPVICHLADSIQMNKGCSNHKDMKDLVALEPDITLARKPSFWNPGSVHDSTSYVQDSHKSHPANGSLAMSKGHTICSHEMNSRNNS
mmetsp:Transcript_75696/g.119951  ORF Transcript_75696/g.119951 Transcript_75696/m.119951 type:complete len:89 (+) Transcript_75696:75-341(+)